jgi:S1-C subfamily serine protease
MSSAYSIKKKYYYYTVIVVAITSLTILLSINYNNNDLLLAQAQTLGNNSSSTISNNFTLPELFSKVEESVVQVSTTINTNALGLFGSGIGSGFVYDKDGHIITNNHVIAGGGSDGRVGAEVGNIDVTLLDGTIYHAKVIGSDPFTDIAVLQLQNVPKDKLIPVSIGNSTQLRVGEKVAAIGNPFDLSGSMVEKE